MSQGFVLDWVAQASLPVFSWEDEHRQGRLCHHSKIHYLAYLSDIRVCLHMYGRQMEAIYFEFRIILSKETMLLV